MAVQIGFKHFLDDLMVHEGSVEPMPILAEKLGEVKVIDYDVEPVLHLFFSCHIFVVFMITSAKVQLFSRT